MKGPHAVCAHHQPEAPMELSSMHSDANRPDQLLGLFVCPDCGFEVRRPLVLEPA